MHTDAAVEGHPVVHMRLVFVGSVCPPLPAQDTIRLLVGQGIRSDRRHALGIGGETRYEIRIEYLLAVLIVVQMLRGQIDLYICIAVIMIPVRRRSSCIYRISLHGLRRGDIRLYLLDLIRLIDLPAV